MDVAQDLRAANFATKLRLMSVETPEIDVSVVVPVYGGERTVPALVERTRAALSERGWSFEILLICDSPRDNSWAVCSGLARDLPSVEAVLLQRNFGQHPATLLGMRLARGQTIVTMDEDLQHAPEDIPRLVELSVAEKALVYGIAGELKHSWWRNLTSRTAKWFIARYLNFRDAKVISPFRAFPATLRAAFETYRSERVAVDVLLSWAGAPIRTVVCRYAEREQGISGYTFGKLVGYLSDLMLGYSTAPLRLASWLGIMSVFVSLGIALFAFITWLRHGSVVPGFAFLAMSIALFSGVQLLSLGLIGEYVGRLYFNSLGKPQYLVATRVRQGDP